MQRSKGGTHGRGVKMKAGLPAVKQASVKAHTDKPLARRVFYLDITSKVASEKLEKDIKDLGGTVEGFLSKEISCLITSKKEAKCTKALKYSGSLSSPEPAQNPGSGSARTGSRRGGAQEGSANKKPEKEDVSRGKSLLKKVIKEQEILPKNSILANALNWGVRILHVDDAKIYLEQKKRLLQGKKPEVASKRAVKQPARPKSKVQKLQNPFIKVEDVSDEYRPLYLVLPCFRSFQSPPSKLCQSVEKKAATTNKATETKQGLNKTWHGQDGANNSHCKMREQKRHGYCECCLQKYDDLEAHVANQKHINFSLGPYYQDVDNLISMFDFDFVDWSLYRQEVKSSALLMPTVTVEWKEKKIADQYQQLSPKISSCVQQTPEAVQRKEPEVPLDCPVANMQSPEPAGSALCPAQTGQNDASGTGSFSVPPGTLVFLPYTDKSQNLEGETITAYEDKPSPIHSPEGPTPAPRMESSSPHPEGEGLPVFSPSTVKSLNSTGETSTALEENMHSAVQAPQGPNLGLSMAAIPITNSSPEPRNESPSKRIKLDGSLVSVTLYSEPVAADHVPCPKPVTDTVPEEPACLSKHSEALDDQSPLGSPSKLHRKVKRLVRKVKRDEPCVPPACKVSILVEDREPCLPPACKVSVPVAGGEPCVPPACKVSVPVEDGESGMHHACKVAVPVAGGETCVPPACKVGVPVAGCEPCVPPACKVSIPVAGGESGVHHACKVAVPIAGGESGVHHACKVAVPVAGGESGVHHACKMAVPVEDYEPCVHHACKVAVPVQDWESGMPPACKVSIPAECCQLNSSRERLISLFETSEETSEFCGFSCQSERLTHTMDAKEGHQSSKSDFLWCFFSPTSSSSGTFHGF